MELRQIFTHAQTEQTASGVVVKVRKKVRREIQCLNFNVPTKIKRSEERSNTAPGKKDVKSARRRGSREQHDFIRGGTLTQENISKDKRKR